MIYCFMSMRPERDLDCSTTRMSHAATPSACTLVCFVCWSHFQCSDNLESTTSPHFLHEIGPHTATTAIGPGGRRRAAHQLEHVTYSLFFRGTPPARNWIGFVHCMPPENLPRRRYVRAWLASVLLLVVEVLARERLRLPSPAVTAVSLKSALCSYSNQTGGRQGARHPSWHGEASYPTAEPFDE